MGILIDISTYKIHNLIRNLTQGRNINKLARIIDKWMKAFFLRDPAFIAYKYMVKWCVISRYKVKFVRKCQGGEKCRSAYKMLSSVEWEK